MELTDLVKNEKPSFLRRAYSTIGRAVGYTLTTAALMAMLGIAGCNTKSRDELVLINGRPYLGDLSNIVANEGDFIKVNPTATDPDGDPVSFAYSSPLDANGEWQTDYDDAGVHAATVTADDGNGGQDSKNFQITVNDVNRDPVLGTIADIVVNENDLVALSPTATDPDNDSLNFTFTAPLDASGQWQTGYSDSGIYFTTVTVNDGKGGQDSQIVQITVNNVNRPPVMGSLSNVTAWEGDTIKVPLSATDPDGDTPLTFSVTSGNGFVNGSNEFEWTPNYSSSGPATSTITVSDGNGGQDSQNLNMTIKDNVIVFDSNTSGSTQVHTMDPDGSNVSQLTTTSTNYEPAWSPDGSKIVFSSYRNGNWEIYEMNADGSGQTRLTNNTATDLSPQYSPDGSKIVFCSDRNTTGIFDIIVMNSDGSNQTFLTTSSDNASPQYSPDGTKIAFSRYDMSASNWEIFVMNADGSNLANRTQNAANENYPSWSTDGNSIVFERNGHIYTMNASDGSNQTALTSGTSTNQYPFYLPNGRQIAYSSNSPGNIEVFLMGTDGSNNTQVTFTSSSTESRPKGK